MLGWGPPLNFFGEASAAVRDSAAEKVQDAPTPTRPAPTDVVVAFVPRGTTPERAGAGRVLAGADERGAGERLGRSDIPGHRPGEPGLQLALRPSDLPAAVSATTSALRFAPPRWWNGPNRRRRKSSRACWRRRWRAPARAARSATRPCRSSRGWSRKSPRLVIAIERPPPAKDRELAIGIAGPGFDGNLTSDSTRLDGYVLSTDVAPTILDFFGVPIPDEMSGQPIRSEGEVDPAAVESLGDRMAVISERRGPVIGLSLLAWLLALGGRRRARSGAAPPAGPPRCVGLSVVYLPLVLLLGAAIEPSEGVEMRADDRRSRRCLPWLTLRARRRLPRAGRGQRRDGARHRDRRHRRLTADRALAARAQSGPWGALLRNRQRARGAALGPRHRRHRRGAGRLRPPNGPLARGRLLPRRRARFAPSSSPSAASAPTSGPRSCCRSAPRWRLRRSAPGGCGRDC